MSDHSHPGSTRVVTLKDELPDWMQYNTYTHSQDAISVELGDKEWMEEKYKNHKLFRQMMDYLMDTNAPDMDKDVFFQRASANSTAKVHVEDFEEYRYQENL